MDIGQKWRWLLASSEGRIGRKDYWFYGVLVTPGMMGAVLGTIAPLERLIGIGVPFRLAVADKIEPGTIGPVSIAAGLGLTFAMYNLRAKRFQDFGASKALPLIWAIGEVIGVACLYAWMFDRGGPPLTFAQLGMGLLYAGIPGTLMMLICGILPGARGPNRYGPDPLAPERPAAARASYRPADPIEWRD